MKKVNQFILLSMLCLTTMFSYAQKKPNILVIMGDDIGWFNPSCYNRGMMGFRTPNIDRIANAYLFLINRITTFGLSYYPS